MPIPEQQAEVGTNASGEERHLFRLSVQRRQ